MRLEGLVLSDALVSTALVGIALQRSSKMCVSGISCRSMEGTESCPSLLSRSFRSSNGFKQLND